MKKLFAILLAFFFPHDRECEEIDFDNEVPPPQIIEGNS